MHFWAVAGAIAVAEPAKETKPAAADKAAARPAEVKLPPGWTEADLKAFMAAATPGEMHKRLAADAGTWQGKNTMWMAPGADPIETDRRPPSRRSWTADSSAWK